MRGDRRAALRDLLFPAGLLASWLGFLGLVALGVSSDSNAGKLVGAFGAIFALMAPFVVGSLVAPSRRRIPDRQRTHSRRAAAFFAAAGAISLVLAPVAFMEEEYGAMGVLGCSAVMFGWIALLNWQQAR